jgi:pimeloyl-ACP methyl ester carboxylesterase
VHWAIPSLVILAVVIVGVCYWGAGIILYPPNMSENTVFPEQFGLRYEKVSFKTADGLTLKGWFMKAPEGDKAPALIMCHGWGDNKGELLKKTAFLAESFNLLYFDFRSHGDSEGDFTTIGCCEVVDFHAAVEFLRRTHPALLKKLGVFGLSMGAAVSTMAAFEHAEVRAVALESPFTDYRQVVKQWAWNNFFVPYFPLVMITLWLLRLRARRPEVDTYSPIRFVGKLAPRPLFIVSGSEDSLMPERDVRALFAAAAEPKQLWIIPGAGHGKCHDVAGLEYETRLGSFFKRHLA